LRSSARWVALALVVLAACAEDQGLSPPPSSVGIDIPEATDLPSLPRTALPGYVVHVSTLDAGDVSADALDPPSLETLLAEARFEVGRESRFTSPARPLTMVVTRVLRFGSPEGAQGYIAWLRNHGRDLLGSQTRSAQAPRLPEAIAFSHDPCISCTKDTFWYFAAWTRGAFAVTLRAGGPHAGLSTAAPLAEELDARVRAED
jgi:hypothetical protein